MNQVTQAIVVVVNGQPGVGKNHFAAGLELEGYELCSASTTLHEIAAERGMPEPLSRNYLNGLYKELQETQGPLWNYQMVRDKIDRALRLGDRPKIVVDSARNPAVMLAFLNLPEIDDRIKVLSLALIATAEIRHDNARADAKDRSVEQEVAEYYSDTNTASLSTVFADLACQAHFIQTGIGDFSNQAEATQWLADQGAFEVLQPDI